MGSKLTLNIDDSVIRRAKEYAWHRNTSLSRVIEGYLEFLTEPRPSDAQISERVARLSDRLQTTRSDEEIKSDHLRSKYLDLTERSI